MHVFIECMLNGGLVPKRDEVQVGNMLLGRVLQLDARIELIADCDTYAR